MAGQWLRNVGQWARQRARQWPAAPLAARWIAARPAVASVGVHQDAVEGAAFQPTSPCPSQSTVVLVIIIGVARIVGVNKAVRCRRLLEAGHT